MFACWNLLRYPTVLQHAHLYSTRKIVPTDCNLGQLKRIVKCIQVSEDDQYMYCGTTSGDVLQVGM